MNRQPEKVFERRFPNQFAALNQVTQEALAFLQTNHLGEPALSRAHLAIEELATNTLKYGYVDSAPHEILLRLEVHPAGLRLLLEDDGRPFNPLAAPEPDIQVPATQRPVGGLGLHLVRQLAADMTYQRCGDHNRVTIEISAES